MSPYNAAMPRTRSDVHSLGRFVIVPVPGMPGLLAYGTDLSSAQANAQEVTALLLRGTAAEPGPAAKPRRTSNAAAPQPGAKRRGRPRKNPLPEVQDSEVEPEISDVMAAAPPVEVAAESGDEVIIDVQSGETELPTSDLPTDPDDQPISA